MLLKRDILVAALAFGVAMSLYLVSFRDLTAAPAAQIEIAQSLP
jgi:hypothetical protein